MTTSGPFIDPQLVARLSNDFTSLGNQMGQVGRDLVHLRTQLEAAAARPQPAAPQYQAAPPPRPQPAYPMQQPQPQPEYPMPPLPQQRQPQQRQPQPAQIPFTPRTPWWQRDGIISRLLAVAGVGVTLIGVVMLLVLAAQAGFFGPVPRVAAGAVLAGVLVYAGMRVFGRTGGRVGGIALAATGVAAAYLDAMAVTTIYGWLDPALGLAVALGVCAGGVALAAKWQAQSLALLVIGGVAVLSPVVADGVTLTLIGFLIVLQIACFSVQLVRPWSYVHVARTLPVVLALLAAITLTELDSTTNQHMYWLLASSIVVALVGIGTAVTSTLHSSTDVTASVMLAISTVPLLLSSVMFDRTAVSIVQGSVGAVLLVVAGLRMLPAHTRIAALAAATIALLQTCVSMTQHETLPIALLVVAIGFVAASGQERSKIAYFIGLGFTFLGALAYLDIASPETLSRSTRAVEQLGVTSVIASLLMVAALTLLVWQAQQLDILKHEAADTIWIIAGVGVLYATTVAMVSAGVAVAGLDGFTAGHCAATIAWMIAATAALLRGLRSTTNAHIALVAGLSLTAAALAKLFLFDLATLDGLLRVSAFIAVGLLLLVAGTKYARAFAEREDQEASADSPASAVH